MGLLSEYSLARSFAWDELKSEIFFDPPRCIGAVR
jgi:hypothetical protein